MQSCNPWPELPVSAPFVLPQDRDAIEAFNASRSATEARRLRTDVLPEPFIGRVDAPVVLLNANPGYSSDDILFTENDISSAAWSRNARHVPSDYSFYPLDPALSWTPTAGWWLKRLGRLIADTDLESVANSVLCIEYFAYHSYKDPRFPGELPSQQYNFRLVEEAIDRGAIILIMRGVRTWRNRVPRLNEHAGAYNTKNPQSAYVTYGMFPDAYPAIVSTIRSNGKRIGQESP